MMAFRRKVLVVFKTIIKELLLSVIWLGLGCLSILSIVAIFLVSVIPSFVVSLIVDRGVFLGLKYMCFIAGNFFDKIEPYLKSRSWLLRFVTNAPDEDSEEV